MARFGRSFKNTQRLWLLSLISYKQITRKTWIGWRLPPGSVINGIHWIDDGKCWLENSYALSNERKTSVFTLPETHSKFTTEKLPGPQKKIFQQFIFSGEQLVSGRGTRWAPTSFKGAALKMSFIPQGVEELLIFLRYLMFSYGHILLSLHPFLPHDGGL